MKHDIKIPTVGESITSGVISVWHKQSGDFVKAGDPILTLETDKVSTEITAEESGKIEQSASEGQEVEIGEVVGTIDGDAQPSGDSEPSESESQESSEPAKPTEPESEETKPEGSVKEQPAKAEGQSPAVRRVAGEEGVDVNKVDGTGKGGRVTKGDVLEFLKKRQSGDAADQEQEAKEESSSSLAVQSSDAVPITTRRRMTPLRRKIAAQLVGVQQEAAILTTFNECDMSGIKSVRTRMQESFQKRHGIKLGFMSFFVKAVVNALQEVPSINSRIDGEDIIENHFYDVGVAVGTEKGLVVPVIRGADRLSFAEIEQALGKYAEKAREGKISLDDLRGGVFTISNGGVYGSLMSTPILNPPQSGILGMHSIQDRPVVVDGEIVIRPMMYLALSYDHRVVDGKEAVTFLVRVKEAIEDPMQLIL